MLCLLGLLRCAPHAVPAVQEEFDFEEALKKTINKSEKADILKELGNIYQKLRDFRRARAKLEEAVKLCQDSAQVPLT